MTYRDPIPEPPPCPICDQPTVVNRHLPERLGPWECEDCRVFCTGGLAEWERYAPNRERRRQLKESNGA